MLCAVVPVQAGIMVNFQTVLELDGGPYNGEVGYLVIYLLVPMNV